MKGIKDPLENFWVVFSEQTQLEELVFLCRGQLSTSLWSVSFGVLLDKLSFLHGIWQTPGLVRYSL
jgi:hypothetical protein